jgi:hypothetical protein
MNKFRALTLMLVALVSLPVLAEEGPSEGSAPPPEAPAAAPASTPNLSYQHKNPFLAGTLSIIPGVGQIYNGEYVVGGIWLVSEIGLYTAALAYMGVFDSSRSVSMSTESIFLFAIAGGLHLFSIYDATTEALRQNSALDKFAVGVAPTAGGFSVAYQARF